MPLNKAVYIILLATVAAACNNGADNRDARVAKVGDKFLFLSEVENFIPPGTNLSDSTLMAEDYIKKWIEKELLIQKAEENLSPEQMDVSKEVKEYRNSLIIYRYKNELVAQKMDTTVTDVEIENYYNTHIETFRLARNIVKAVFVKIPLEVADEDLLKLYCSNQSDEEFRELKEYSLQYAKSFDTFNGSWVDFSRVLLNLPAEVEDQKSFLSRNSLYETSDDEYYYLVCIRDFKLTGEPAPIGYVQQQIKSLILNRRKLEFLKKVEQDIYNEGMRTNKFNIYDVENNTN